jgi:hypothetical protein
MEINVHVLKAGFAEDGPPRLRTDRGDAIRRFRGC